MRQPTFSVIIPTYNRWWDLHQAIKSVQAQTYTDWELIVVDDGSTDYTRTFLTEEIVESRMRWWTIPHSGSPVAPRNAGVTRARGSYLAFLDSDDLWSPRKLETVATWIDSAYFRVLFYHDLRVGSKLWSDMSHCHSGNNVHGKLLVKNFIPTSSVVIPRGLWQPMDPALTISHDWDLWLKIARVNAVHYIPMVLGTLSMHGGSVITETRRRRAESREVVRRHRSSCSSLMAKVEATVYYYLVEVYDRWKSLRG